jgi:hypothetical protein
MIEAHKIAKRRGTRKSAVGRDGTAGPALRVIVGVADPTAGSISVVGNHDGDDRDDGRPVFELAARFAPSPSPSDDAA